GTTWSTTPVAVNNLVDPTSFSTPQAQFTQNEHVSVSYDRLHNFYLVSAQHNNANDSGAIVLSKFNFSGSAPTRVDLDPLGTTQDQVLYRWSGQDPAFNPVVAVDTNLPSFTDPVSGKVQTDTMANNLATGTLGSVNSLTLTGGGSGY